VNQTGKKMNVYLAKFMTYFEIHRMHREGHSISQISQYLVINRRTVSKYLSMSEQEYEAFLASQSDRKKVLLPYENFVKERLQLYQNTPAEKAFKYITGIPDEIVYDQDKVFIVSENHGDIILTQAFRAYTSGQSTNT
jgi:transposase